MTVFKVLKYIAAVAVLFGIYGIVSKEREVREKPNIIIIYADDLGYGDVSSYGASLLHTPNIDTLASEGIRFTQGYCTSATCTPSRYALLSGRYPWRNKKARILAGNAPMLIRSGMTTLPAMLKKAGYKTAIVGKWHLGLGDGHIDWNKKIEPGPRDVGFDYEYIMAATNDRVPTVFIENDYVEGLDPEDPIAVSYKHNFPGEPTGKKNRELLKILPSHGHNNSIVNGIGRIGFMKGGKSARWIDEDMADIFLAKAQRFIKQNRDRPFFLYYALHQPHVPRTPHARFVGKSGLGPRGDAIVEADWCVGQLMKTLKTLGIEKNTIVIFSSDNGPVLDDGYQDDAVTRLNGHTPLGGLRGGKYSLFDGGTHVPFIVRWKDHIKPGVSDALVCQIDFLASFADLLGVKTNTGDSKSVINAFLGKSKEGRQNLVLEASGKVAYRQGDWVLIPPYKGPPKTNKWVNIETGNSNKYQLYKLSKDKGQQKNLAQKFPEKVRELTAQLNAIKKGGSAPAR